MSKFPFLLIFSIVFFCALTLGCGVPRSNDVLKPSKTGAAPTRPDDKGNSSTPSSAGFGSGEEKPPASMPEGLFRVQDPNERAAEYKELTKKMIGDLEFEIKLQEGAANQEEVASPSGLKK